MEAFNWLMKIAPDPIKWVDDLFCLLRYGRGDKLTWANVSGWSGGRVEMLLRHHGLRVYRRQYAFTKDDDYGVHVPRAQGRWAEYVLRRAGCPLTGPILYESNRNVRPGPVRAWADTNPKAARRPTGLAGYAFAAMARLWRRK